MKIALSAFGSRGDVQPIMLTALALREAGHEVHLCTVDNFIETAGALGLPLTPCGMNLDDYKTTPGTRDANGEMIRFLRDAISAQRRWVTPIVADSDVYVAGFGDFLGPSIAEVTTTPFASRSTNVLFPLRGEHPHLNRVLWRLHYGAINLVAGRPVNRARAALGLRPIKHLLQHRENQGLTILAYDDALAPTPERWRDAGYRFAPVGYCMPPETLDPMPRALDAFLDAPGPPIVYVGFGSMNTASAVGQTRMIVDAAKRAQCRVVIGRGRGRLGLPADEPTPDHVIFADRVSHTRLFPRLSGVIHHGGAGTTHTAAHAAVPQAVVAHLADQRFWGTMVHEHGVGPEPQAIAKLNASRLASTMRVLTTRARLRQGAQALAARMQPRDLAPTRAVPVIEALANSGSRASQRSTR